MFTYRITPDGGEPFNVRATSRDIARWERTTHGASFAKLTGDRHVTDLYAVAFHAAVRQGLMPAGWTLKQFEESADLDLVAVDDEDETEDPTQSAV